ncbi:MAG TPA: PaaI family thioesterase [Candidatus Limnocylindria bacterium]|nr:PaaI family thioesterase [Candidatus Limnocylindria bacterium]
MPPVPEQVEVTFPDDGGCFGCSPTNPRGLALRFRRVGDEMHARYTVPDAFHGAPGVVHGGIVATLLDEVSCALVALVLDRRVVTGELSVRYERPVPVGEPLDLVARVASRSHPRYVVVDGEVRLGGLRLAGSTGKFFYQPDRPTAP